MLGLAGIDISTFLMASVPPIDAPIAIIFSVLSSGNRVGGDTLDG
ncbi:hypothetical protein [Paraglaciecola polaris]|uniref:Uncharacterized protein n=1 Tax=Paraglaciecola polaris LMG 21857 TaxID=1129793 RepID=K7AEV3_9ALTE|nr:hypothetical protein [Paraglaciecola polaris]GAC33815.1 hypothetical protein GPLA_2922 [Paraglaciecola polaris LMG 21857]